MDRESVHRYFGLIDQSDLSGLKVALGKPHGINDRFPFGGANLLGYAAHAGNLKVCQFLIEQGADVDGIGYMNWSALMMAAGANQLDVVKLLLGKGADLRYRSPDTGVSAVHWAAGKNAEVDVLNLLLDHGADPNAAIFSGLEDEPVTHIFEGTYPEGKMRPLHFALMKEEGISREILDALIRSNADPTLKTVSRKVDSEVEVGGRVPYEPIDGKSPNNLMSEARINL